MVATEGPKIGSSLRKPQVRSGAREGLADLDRPARISRKSEWRRTVSGPGSHSKCRSRLEQSCLSVSRSGCPVLVRELDLDLETKNRVSKDIRARGYR